MEVEIDISTNLKEQFHKTNCSFLEFTHLYSNTLAVGISDYDSLPGDEDNNILFEQMYSGSGNFSREEYYSRTPALEFKQDRFKITGNMGTSHDTVIYFDFYFE